MATETTPSLPSWTFGCFRCFFGKEERAEYRLDIKYYYTNVIVILCYSRCALPGTVAFYSTRLSPRYPFVQSSAILRIDRISVIGSSTLLYRGAKLLIDYATFAAKPIFETSYPILILIGTFAVHYQ